MKFNTVKLGEYLYIKGRIGWKGLKKKEYLEKSGFRIVNGEALTENGIDWNKAGYISKERYDESPEIMLQQDDILISKDGTIGKIGYVDSLDTPTTVASGIFVIRNQMPEIINTRFIYHFFNSKYFKDFIIMRTEGSVIPHLYQKDFVDLDFPMPELRVQDKIVGILDVINNKIKLNKSINNNLLEQALTMFSTQFAALDRNGCIGDYCSVKSGFAFKSSWWTTNGVKVIKIGSINQDNLNLSECSYVDEDKVDKAKDFKVIAGDLLIAMTGATIGKFAMVPYSSDTLLVNQRVGKFFLGNNPVEKLPFIYCTLKQPDVYYEIVNRGQGSAQPNISASDIMSISCVIPSKEAINKFNKTLQPLFDLIISNQRENQQLSTLRDSLLPKLMSGELDVSDIDI